MPNQIYNLTTLLTSEVPKNDRKKTIGVARQKQTNKKKKNI